MGVTGRGRTVANITSTIAAESAFALAALSCNACAAIAEARIRGSSDMIAQSVAEAAGVTNAGSLLSDVFPQRRGRPIRAPHFHAPVSLARMASVILGGRVFGLWARIVGRGQGQGQMHGIAAHMAATALRIETICQRTADTMRHCIAVQAEHYPVQYEEMQWTERALREAMRTAIRWMRETHML